MEWALILAAAMWLALLLVPWRPWATSERMESDVGPDGCDLHEVTVLMPARNESDVIGRALAALARQGGDLRIIVIDDASDDGTAIVAARADLPGLTILQAPPLPPGWTGKLWALEQGRLQVETPYILLLDADIWVAPGLVATLLHKAQHERLALVSLMAAPAMQGLWDRWLMPVFIYFFKLLYPFRLAHAKESRYAAAAGGCLLVSRGALADIGGFGALKGAVIDDCTLAARIKHRAQGAIWIGLTHSAKMMRSPSLRDVWRMVARTAFTQLRYSFVLLALCAAVMVLVFVIPVIGLVWGGLYGRLTALMALIFMISSYIPTARFYAQPRTAWALLPLAGLAFLLMTFTSALWYARGVRSRWKGRAYGRSEG